MTVAEKNNLHPRNRHRGRYDFPTLIKALPELAEVVYVNDYGDESVDFADPDSVKLLNKAILKSFYKINFWDIPGGYLCPPIPGRADYIHYVADLVGAETKNVRVLDIGVGANCVYPLIGNVEYGWKFVGSDIDPKAIENAKKIVDENKLTDTIELRLQATLNQIFKGVINESDRFNLTICNPPFHASEAEASAGTNRKLKNLGLASRSRKYPTLNFGGQAGELWVKGGEFEFVKNMILESEKFKEQCQWFTSLISKRENVAGLEAQIKKLGATQFKIIEMSQGQKSSRIIAWTFQGKK
jgi:23S rRNA (adenine1618-N6)-methyltransferase